LCVPEYKRNSVLQVAHDSVFGGHLAERKTRERVRLSFYWPQLRQSVKQYVAACHDCQFEAKHVRSSSDCSNNLRWRTILSVKHGLHRPR